MLGLAVQRIALLFGLFAVPLLFLPNVYLAFELPKILFVYLISTLCFLGLWIGNFKFKQPNILVYSLILFLVWLVFSAMIGASIEQSVWGNYFRRQGIVTYVAYLGLFLASGVALRGKNEHINIAVAIMSSSLFVALFAIYQFTDLWVFHNEIQLLYSKRIIATFGQPNFLGAYLVMVLPFAWYLTCTHKRVQKYLAWTSMLILIGAIGFTVSRSAWLGAAILIAIWAFGNWKRVVGILVSGVLIVSIFATVFPLLLFQQLQRFELDTAAKWTAENRGGIAVKSFELIAKRPITGWGVENFNLAFPTVVGNLDFGLKDITVDSAHNLFLDIAVGTGLLGITVYLFFIVNIFKSGLNHLKEASTDKDFIKALICVEIAYLVCHQFSIISAAPSMLFWVVAGILVGPLLEHARMHTSYIKLFLSGLVIEIVLIFVIQNYRADTLFRESFIYEVSDIKRAIKLQDDAISTAPWIKHYQWRRDYLKNQLGE